MTGADYVVVWDGRRPAAAPVAPPPPSVFDLEWTEADEREAVARARHGARKLAAMRRRARVNKARPVLTLAHKRRIWRLLKRETTAQEIANRVGVPVRPVIVLLSKARRAGLVVGGGRRGYGRQGLYTRAAGVRSSAINFPPIGRKVYQA